LYYDQFQSMASSQSMIVPFVKEMDYLYAAADLIISRAGASTISELTQVGKPVVFIPSPNVAEDHQMKNAQAVAQLQAAVVIAEKDLGKDFDSVFRALSQDEERQQLLGDNIKSLARPEALNEIIQTLECLVG